MSKIALSVKLRKKLRISLFLMISIISLILVSDLFIRKFDGNQYTGFNNNQRPHPSFDYLEGKPLAVNQYANISKSYEEIIFPMNLNFDLAPQWKSKNVTVEYHGVSNKKNWATNGDFESDISGWTFKTNNPVGFTLPGYDSWGNPSGSAKFRMTGSRSAGDYAYFEQNISISEEFATGNALFYMDYQLVWTSTFNGSIFMSLLVDGVEKNKTIHLTDAPKTSWESLILSYDPTSYGQILPNNVTLRIGVHTWADDSISPWNEVYFENLRCELWTKPNDSGLVKIEDEEFNQNYTYINTNYGEGYSFIDVERYRETSDTITFTVYQNVTDVLDFKIENITINSFGVKSFSSQFMGNARSKIAIGSNITWSNEISISSIPVEYTSLAQIEKPTDWLFTSIIDSYEVEYLDNCSGTNLGDEKLTIPNTILNAGLWKLTAISKNYISESNLKVWNGSVFISNTSLTYGDQFLINVTLNDSISLADTLLNCSIYYPNASILWEESKEPVSYYEKFENFNVGDNMSTGEYRVEIVWTNNLSSLNIDQIGYAELNFIVWHHTNLTTTSDYIELVAGDPLIIRANFTDYDFNTFIDFALITYNTSYGTSGSMTYQGLGRYFIDLDTSSLNLGDYYLSFNASKAYYENISKHNFIHIKIIAQPLALEVPRTVLNSLGNSYVSCSINVTGSISGAPLWPANVSSDWSYGYTNISHNNGTYTFNFSTEGLPLYGTLESFTIKIMANKTDYGETFDFISLTIFPIPTAAYANETFKSTFSDQIVTVKVNYTEEASGLLITNPVCNVTWDGISNFTYDSGSIILDLNTHGLILNDYTAIVKLTKSGYASAFLSISILIIEKSVEIELYHNGTKIGQNTQIDASLLDFITFSCRIYSDSENQYVVSEKIDLICDNYVLEVSHSGNYWYNFSIEITADDFSLGINYFLIEFDDINYTRTSFSFQILITQREYRISPQNFQESIEINPGDNILIKINLTDDNTGLLIEDVNITCSSNFGFDTLEYIGNGIYEIELEPPVNFRGNHKITLTINTVGGIYKFKQYSFFVGVVVDQTQTFPIWIIVAALLIVVTILGFLSVRSYVILPRRRKIESEILEQTQPFKDISNIQAILISHRVSGVSIFSRTYSILNKDHIIGFSGLIQAITLAGDQFTKENVEDREIEIERISEDIRELDFNIFHALTCDFKELRIVFILKEKASERLRKELYVLTSEIYLKCEYEIVNFKGSVNFFEEKFPEIINKYFPLPYKERFTLNPNIKYYNKLKNSGELTTMESRILKVLEKYSETRDQFFLNTIMNLTTYKKEHELILTIESLIEKKATSSN